MTLRLVLIANARAIAVWAAAIISVRRWIEGEQAEYRRTLA